MPRKRVLPQYITAVIDRHGKERFRFRRKGLSLYLPHPGAPDFKEKYRAALANEKPIKPRAKPRSIGALVPEFYNSLEFTNGGAGWQHTVRLVLEPFREEFKDDLVADFEPRDIEKILRNKQKQTVMKGRKVGGTAAALRLYEQLLRLFDRAVYLEWRADNPVRKLKVKPKHDVKGYYAWEDDDISRFQARWPLGTKQRLAMELMLWSGSRRGDAHRIGPANIKDGKLAFTASKTGKLHVMPIMPPLRAAMDAMDRLGSEALVETAYGKPFSRAGFGNWFKEACVKAGLPKCTAHGLRKALATRAASGGATQQELKAIGGWSGDREVAVYIENANRETMAEEGLGKVERRERSKNVVQPSKTEIVQPVDLSQKTAGNDLTMAGAEGKPLEGNDNDLA